MITGYGVLLKPTAMTHETHVDDLSPTRAVGGRVLFVLTAVLLLVMPWTEYYWHFDKFLRGGEDLEFGLLFVITMFCLALVLVQRCEQGVISLFASRRWLCFILKFADPSAPGSFLGLIAATQTAALPSPALRIYTLPLQV
jgi:hypothetical protein